MGHEFEVKDLGLKYSGTSEPILEHLDLNIEKGGFHILLGQNGSGKSSFMKCLAGIQHWTVGDIFRNGHSRKTDAIDFNKDLVFISEEIALPNFEINTLAKIYEEVWKKFDYDFFTKLLTIAEVPKNRSIKSVSRGQQALVQLALAMAAGIKTLLIDEVTAVLDPYVRQRIVSELVKYNSTGATILVATNIATEFTGINARIILLEKGKIYLEGQLADVAKEFVKIEVTEKALSELPGSVIIKENNQSLTLMVRKVAVSNSFKVSEQPIVLEDIFIFLSGQRFK